MGGWVGYGKIEENEAVRMSYCKLWVGGWVEEDKAVRMSYWIL